MSLGFCPLTTPARPGAWLCVAANGDDSSSEGRRKSKSAAQHIDVLPSVLSRSNNGDEMQVAEVGLTRSDQRRQRRMQRARWYASQAKESYANTCTPLVRLGKVNNARSGGLSAATCCKLAINPSICRLLASRGRTRDLVRSNNLLSAHLKTGSQHGLLVKSHAGHAATKAGPQLVTGHLRKPHAA